ncbi:MAG TPA: D-glycerate dehydrogenase, partial [Ignavibacteriales bacterium]|nr:D-glycerate dehydrogenase [Ignavibacteriales bacterium]
MSKVVITGNLPAIAEKMLKESGISVKKIKADKTLTPKELIKEAKDADGLITLLSNKVTGEVIGSLNKCKVIANYAVGYNNIDVAAATAKGIAVCNTPDVLTDATADIAMLLALGAARKAVEGEEIMRSGKFKGWAPQLLLGIELKGKTFGIIGAGRIGSATAKRAKAFGCKIVYYSRSRNKSLEKETGAKKLNLDSLLEKSDFISLHIPLTEKTRGLIDKDKLKLLKKTAIIINTARGEVIDEKELIKMLKTKRIFAAGFDVYEGEPDVNKDLLKLENVFLLPHLG